MKERTDNQYIHGYHSRESVRLQDQASTLVDLLLSDTFYEPGSKVLEAGCGVGAQTITLARNNPNTRILAFDISEQSLARAQSKIEKAGLANVKFQKADIFNLPYPEHSFDHVFVCFVLEHLPQPLYALQCLKKVLKPGGTITVIEGDHGSVYFYPQSEAAQQVVNCQIRLQSLAGGNALMGRELYPLLNKVGFLNCFVSPRMVYVDASKPDFVEGFTKNTFTAMMKGIRLQALDSKKIDRETFDKGIRDLYRTTEKDGVFCYTFFKAFAQVEKGY